MVWNKSREVRPRQIKSAGARYSRIMQNNSGGRYCRKDLGGWALGSKGLRVLDISSEEEEEDRTCKRLGGMTVRPRILKFWLIYPFLAKRVSRSFEES